MGHARTRLGAQIAAQPSALTEADAVAFVLDATVGATDADTEVARVLQRADIPVLVVANKADDADTELAAASLWSLGLGEPFPTSALHGRRAGDLLDVLVTMLPRPGRGSAATAALVGLLCSGVPMSVSRHC